MAYDDELAQRIRKLLARKRGVTEQHMFGGFCFLLYGNMVAGVGKGNLMIRVGPVALADALAKPHARPMTFTGRPLKTMVYVGRKGCATAATLRTWLERGLKYGATLPRK